MRKWAGLLVGFALFWAVPAQAQDLKFDIGATTR